MCCYQICFTFYSKSNSNTWRTCSYDWIQVTWPLVKSTQQYQVSQTKAVASRTFHLTSNQYAPLLRISSLGPFLHLPVSTSLVSSFVVGTTATAVRELFLHMAVDQTRYASPEEQMASLVRLDRYVTSIIFIYQSPYDLSFQMFLICCYLFDIDYHHTRFQHWNCWS